MSRAWTAKDVEQIMLISEGVVSLNMSIDKDGEDLETELGDLLEDPEADVEANALKEAKYAYLRETLDTILTTRERYVILRRYGFVGENSKTTLEDIGQEMHITRERVRQIEAKALRKLRMYFARKKLREDNL